MMLSIHQCLSFLIKENQAMNGVIRSCARSLMFKPPARKQNGTARLRADDKNVWLSTITGDSIHCRLVCPWDKDTRLSTFARTDSLILFMHGNADDVSSCQTYCQWISDHSKSNMLVFDYPGYGFSSGDDNTTQEGMEEAAVTVLDYALTILGHQTTDIFLIGKSIGSFPAVSLAAQPFAATIRGLLLISAIASAARCVGDVQIFPVFVARRLDSIALANIDLISKVRCPIFFVHGTLDKVVNHSNSEALFAASLSDFPPLFVEAGHNDIESKFLNLFLQSMQEFTEFCAKKKNDDAANDSAKSPYNYLG